MHRWPVHWRRKPEPSIRRTHLACVRSNVHPDWSFCSMLRRRCCCCTANCQTLSLSLRQNNNKSTPASEPLEPYLKWPVFCQVRILGYYLIGLALDMEEATLLTDSSYVTAEPVLLGQPFCRLQFYDATWLSLTVMWFLQCLPADWQMRDSLYVSLSAQTFREKAKKTKQKKQNIFMCAFSAIVAWHTSCPFDISSHCLSSLGWELIRAQSHI